MKNSSNEWMGISDMMSGLMLVFLFVAVGFMVEVQSQKDAMRDIALEYKDTQSNLNEALYTQFENDLEIWDATITKDNRIIFNSPSVLFDISSSKVNSEFKTILDEFFPKLIDLLETKEFKKEIDYIRIDGHTSKVWGDLSDKKRIYLNNMKLSQQRAYSVLQYCYNLDDKNVVENRDWLEKKLRANGIAYAKYQDETSSRKVEFSIVFKSEDKIYKIVNF